MNERLNLLEKTYRQQLTTGCQSCGLPRHMWESLVEYVVIGRPLGEFLEALVSNDLLQAVKKADGLNAQCFKDYVLWLESVAPATCFGSNATYHAWVRSGGVIGQARSRPSEE